MTKRQERLRKTIKVIGGGASHVRHNTGGKYGVVLKPCFVVEILVRRSQRRLLLFGQRAERFCKAWGVED